jgi:hypothetical protein
MKMTKKADKKAKVGKQIKKGARKLVAALPLAALLVEEVRAAEGLSDERLEELALQEELKKKQGDTLLMAGAADADQANDEDVVADGKTDDAAATDDAVQADADAVIDGADPRSGDVLLALNDTDAAAASQGGSIAGESSGFRSVMSGSGGATNIVSQALEGGFELSSLPLLAAANPVGLAVFGALGLVAVNNTNATAPLIPVNEITTDGTHLATSLKDLQAAGVNAVNVAAGVTDLHVALGAAGTLSSAGLPVFGDSNLDGELSTAEDAALNVTLDVTSAAQLAELSGLGGLSSLTAAGIDNVQFNLADQAALTSLLGDANLASELLALNTAGLAATTINMADGQTAHLSLADAGTLVADGLHFASGDQVSVDLASADGTHLNTSLQNLQALGVTAVNTAGAAGDVHIGFGASDALNTAGLPQFSAAHQVTLDAVNATQLHAAAGAATALAASGIDHVNLNLADQTAFNTAFAAGNTVATDMAALNAGHLPAIIDMADNAVTLSLAQAQAFDAQGIHFAADDVVTVNAGGTHLGASLQDLQSMGVNVVNTAGAAGDMHISMGASDTFNAAGLPTFTADHAVTLDLANVAQLHSASLAATTLHTAGIDNVQLNFADQAAFDASFATGNTVNSDLAALRGVGIHGNTVDMASNAVSFSDVQSHALAAGNVHFAANDVVDVTAHGTHMASTLSDLHKLGVDVVHADAGITHLSLDVGDAAALAAAGSLPVFDAALDVSLNIHNSADFAALAHADLAAMHIDNLEFSTADSLDSILVDGLSVLNQQNLTVTDYGDLLQVLTESGLSHIDLVQAPADHVTVSDDLTAALYDAGMLQALPDANVTITADAVSTDLPATAVLETSLKAMAELGVDAVDTTDAVQKVYVELGANADVADIIHGFTTGSDLPADGLFEGKDAGLVIDQATFNTLSQGDVTQLLGQLSELGFTEIDVLKTDGTADKQAIVTTVAQAPVLGAVETLGAADTTALHDVFDTDIKDKHIG